MNRKNTIKSIQCLLIIVSLFFCLPIMADDTDIFVGSPDINNNANSSTRPNVLFIIDNSESMTMKSLDAQGRDTGVTRMAALKSAFSNIVNTVQGANVGLVRFDGGASIMQPITPIDQPMPKSFFSATSEQLTGNDDAQEINGGMDTVNGVIHLGFTKTQDSGGSQYFTQNIQSAINEHSENRVSGKAIASDKMVFDADTIHALRFGLTLPKNANIISASLTFQVAKNFDTDGTAIEIRGQSIDNPAGFSSSDFDLLSRWNGAVTSSPGYWKIGSSTTPAFLIVKGRYMTNDISAVIQQLVNQPDYNPNDAVVLLLKHFSGMEGLEVNRFFTNGQPSAYPINPPNLTITYAESNLTVHPTRVGLRYENVLIPQGATIESAHLLMAAANPNNEDDQLTLDINIEDNTNPAEFSQGNFHMSARAKLAIAPVEWRPAIDWPSKTYMRTPDISALVQELVNKPSWCGNNALALQITPTAKSGMGNRTIYTMENNLPTRLVVKYLPPPKDAPAPANCVNEIINASNYKSAREDLAGVVTLPNMDNRISTLPLVQDNWYGIQFRLDVNQGPNIINAYATIIAFFFNDMIANPGLTADVWGEAADNSAAFDPQQLNNLSSRPRTATQLRWSTPVWSQGSSYTSNDLSAILNEIISRPGWQNGNTLSLLLKVTQAPNIVETNATTTTVKIEANPELGTSEQTMTILGTGERITIYPRFSTANNQFKLTAKVKSGETTSTTIHETIPTIRQELINRVNDLQPLVRTPIVDALYEAQRYFSGQRVTHGKNRVNPDTGLPSSVFRVSHPDSYFGGNRHNPPLNCIAPSDWQCRDEVIAGNPNYKSPIKSNCQANHIVLLTDGDALGNKSIDRIKNLTGATNCDGDASNPNEQCGRTLVEWMANNPAIANWQGSTIHTHTIAYNLQPGPGLEFLKDLSAKGLGTFNTAGSQEELINALTSIFNEINENDVTFTPAAATINQFNRLQHREDMYFSVFKPSTKPRWSGNVKRYALGGQPATLLDKNGRNAIDAETGFFKDNSHSFWSTETDGSRVNAGGSASKLPEPLNRKVLTDLNSNAIYQKQNHIDPSNTDITAAQLDATDDNERAQLLKWIRGMDVLDEDTDNVTNEARLHMGDPLHSAPTTVVYGGSNETPDMSIFFGTNEGFIHAINAQTGVEQFAFMPASLLKNIKPQMLNKPFTPRVYGMDGSPVIWRHETIQDGDIRSSEGDFVYLYMGMRRGGRDYYALDITDRNQPTVLWKIQGGSGDFAALGQSWSTPLKTQVRIANTVKDVLIFGGGFDPNMDGKPDQRIKVSSDGGGNAIYMVDAKTGELLWMASSSTKNNQGLKLDAMQYAIPSNIEVLDINQDGLADQFFVGDLGGQLWRFNIQHGNAIESLVTGGLLANLSDNATGNNRRFFFAPDISFLNINGERKMALAIGSGSLIDPLSKQVNDRFYVLQLPIEAQTSAVITENNLNDLTDRINDADESGAISAAKKDADATMGWYIRMEGTGEKVLAPSITANHQIIFTTYIPDSAINACTVIAGQGRYYVISSSQGKPFHDKNMNNQLDKEDRFSRLKSTVIGAQPKILFSEDQQMTFLVGTEKIEVEMPKHGNFQRSYWYKQTKPQTNQ